MRQIKHALNIADLKNIARRRLPAPLFNYIDGGSDDETTRFGNERAFGRVNLLPRFLVDVAHIDTRTTVLGQQISMPLMLSPTGMSRLFHYQGELAVARAAASAGTCYSLSTLGSCNIEQVGAASDGPKCFQIYVMRDRGITREFIRRCKDAGFTSMALTVDVPVGSNRERELRYGFAMPPKLTLKSLAGFAIKPGWLFRHFTNPPVCFANVVHKIQKGSAVDQTSLMEYIADQFDPSVTWQDMEWMIDEWGGPFAIKGVLAPDDARRAVAVGASAIVVSNHGGRQLDSSPAAFDALGPIVDEVGGEAEIILEGGIRRGTHVLKALARGATACAIGRPYLYGLAAGGEAGVSHALGLLRGEIETNMALLGCRSVNEIGPQHLVPADPDQASAFRVR